MQTQQKYHNQYNSINISFQSEWVMIGQRNWNDMSSEQDSWYDSEDDRKEEKKVEATGQPQKAMEKVDEAEVDFTAEQPQQSHKEQQKQEPQQVQNKKQAQQRKHKFLKDEDLLTEYTNKTVDDPRVIKAVKVFNEQHKTLLQSLKNARVKQVRDGIFILNFESPDGVLQFIREKIANRYRFFLQPFFKRKEEEPREERRERNEEKRRDRERRPRYQDEKEDQEKRARRENEPREHRQPRDNKREREEEKGKKVYVAKESYDIEDNKNVLIIKSQGFEIDRVIEQLDEKKVFKNFNKLRIKAPYSVYPKVSKLIAQISSKYKFNLEKEPPADTKKEDTVELTLIENLQSKSTQNTTTSKPPEKQPQRHQQKPSKPSKESRPQPPPAPKGEQIVHSRKLGSNYDEYFSNISIYNLSEIVKGFDENEYVKRLKENSSTIFQKNWNSWKIEAQDEYIEPLLKLTHRLKKSTLYDVDLKPAMRNLKPILTAELKPRPQKDRRPKVDVSGVNGYLS